LVLGVCLYETPVKKARQLRSLERQHPRLAASLLSQTQERLGLMRPDVYSLVIRWRRRRNEMVWQGRSNDEEAYTCVISFVASLVTC